MKRGDTISAKGYVIVWGVLLIMLLLTWGVAEVDLGRWNPVLAMSIAMAKAILIVLYFMHVRFASRMTWLFAGAGFFWLAILIGLTMSDYLTRGWIGE